MSDSSQGPGWWQASDGKWYPPESAPGVPAPVPAGGPGNLVDVGSSLSWAWTTFTKDAGTWVAIGAIYLVINLIFNVAPRFTNSTLMTLFLPLVGFILTEVMLLNLHRFTLGATRGERPDTGKLFQFEDLGGWIVGAIVFAIIVVVGFMLCCIPGILAFLAFGFWGMVFVDQKQGGIDSIKGSMELTKGKWGSLIVFWVVIWALTFLATAVTCGLAALVTYPVGYLAVAHAYRTMRGEAVVPA